MISLRNNTRTLGAERKASQRQAALIQRQAENGFARFLQSLDGEVFEVTRNQLTTRPMG